MIEQARKKYLRAWWLEQEVIKLVTLTATVIPIINTVLQHHHPIPPHLPVF
jgi:hypothetical protein